MSPHNRRCGCRARVATEIVTTKEKDTLIVKLRYQWLRELLQCARDGVCSLLFYTYLCDVAALYKLSTRDVEGSNSIIKWMGKLAPNMSWPLMSGRFVVKKYIAEELPNDPRQDPGGARRQHILACCVNHHALAAEEWRRQNSAILSGEQLPMLALEHGEGGEEESQCDQPEDDDANVESAPQAPGAFVPSPGHPNYDLQGSLDNCGQLHLPRNFTDLETSAGARLWLRFRKSFESTMARAFTVSSAFAFGAGQDLFMPVLKFGRSTYWFAQLRKLTTARAVTGTAPDLGAVSVVQICLPPIFYSSKDVFCDLAKSGAKLHSVVVSALEWHSINSAKIVLQREVPLKLRAAPAAAKKKSNADSAAPAAADQIVVAEWQLSQEAAAEDPELLQHLEELRSATESIAVDAEKEDTRAVKAFVKTCSGNGGDDGPDESPDGTHGARCGLSTIVDLERKVIGLVGDNEAAEELIEALQSAGELGEDALQVPETAAPAVDAAAVDEQALAINLLAAVVRFSNLILEAMAGNIIRSTPKVGNLCIADLNSTYGGSPIACTHWVHLDSLEPAIGRVVQLDAANRITYAPPSTRSQLDILQMRCATNVAMVRARGPLRAEMPEALLSIFAYFQRCGRAEADQADHRDRTGLDLFRLSCQACNLIGQDVVACPLCECAMHPACAERLAMRFGGQDAAVVVRPGNLDRRVASAFFVSELVCACCAKIILID